MTSTSNFFDVVLFLLSSLVTGPNFMSMSSLVLELWQFSFIRDWPENRKSEIPTSEYKYKRLGQVMDTKFGTNVSNKMGLNARKFQYYSFYHFWAIKGKPTGGLKLPPPTLGLMNKRDNRGNKTERVIPLFGAILIKHLAQANQKMLVSFYQITYFKILKQYFLTIKLSKIFLILSNV